MVYYFTICGPGITLGTSQLNLKIEELHSHFKFGLG